MTQEGKRRYLIEELLKERKESAQIPADKKSQQDLLRALMNVRDPLPISQEFLQVQDEYLQERNKERGIINIEDFECIKRISEETGGQLYLWQGDITTLKVDAIVNAANAQLLGCFSPLHACIDNCIHTYAGIQLRLACYELMQKQGKLEGTGLCKITQAFNLPSRFVLHTVGPIIRTVVGARDKILLENCYKNCLDTAAENGLESVAFCCISTGVFRFPADLAAQLAVKTVEEWLMANPEKSVKKVVFNVFGNKDLDIYKGIFGIK
ncbi:MAG: protein-ADP-ribose hydrolase [Treponema sp.]|nr:protein-ADP-ribose hydrolase [Treponema sp.]